MSAIAGSTDDTVVRQDMLPAVLIGALLSSAFTLPMAYPLQASNHDLGLLAMLGVVQLAIPCLLARAPVARAGGAGDRPARGCSK
jgi:hypothetical protein